MALGYFTASSVGGQYAYHGKQHSNHQRKRSPSSNDSSKLSIERYSSTFLARSFNAHVAKCHIIFALHSGKLNPYDKKYTKPPLSSVRHSLFIASSVFPCYFSIFSIFFKITFLSASECVSDKAVCK
jgi:hypothetical protein